MVTAPPSEEPELSLETPQAAALTINAAKRFRIGRDAVNTAVQDLAKDESDAITWLWSYCSRRDLDKSQMETLLQMPSGKYYSYDSIYQSLTGRRSGAEVSLERICLAIGSLRRSVENVAVRDGFKETRLAREIWNYCEKARKRQKIGFIFGDMSIGKSAAIDNIPNEQGKIISVRMPTRGHLNHFLQAAARRLAMGDRQSVLDLSDRVIKSFTTEMLLIIDEADQCFSGVKTALGLSTLDFLRELWDRSRCGIVMIMDHAGRDKLLHGPDAKRMKRLWRRRLPQLNLPAVPYEEDLSMFAANYGLPPAPDETTTVRITYFDLDGIEQKREHKDNPLRLQQEFLRADSGGLTLWLDLLKEAHEMAKEQKRAITWGAVIKAHASMLAAEANV
jgi:DNA transposition AAA+ family ATPase